MKSHNESPLKEIYPNNKKIIKNSCGSCLLCENAQCHFYFKNIINKQFVVHCYNSSTWMSEAEGS
jgi:hypothetical protein